MRREIETWQQVETAYASGIGLREIARNLNIAEGTVLSRAKREGWSRRIKLTEVASQWGRWLHRLVR